MKEDHASFIAYCERFYGARFDEHDLFIVLEQRNDQFYRYMCLMVYPGACNDTKFFFGYRVKGDTENDEIGIAGRMNALIELHKQKGFKGVSTLEEHGTLLMKRGR